MDFIHYLTKFSYQWTALQVDLMTLCLILFNYLQDHIMEKPGYKKLVIRQHDKLDRN